MGRELKRVPLGFDYPINTIWDGYLPTLETLQSLFGAEYPYLYTYTSSYDVCEKCEQNAGRCSERAGYCFFHNPENKRKWFKEVPDGEGYQLWENTTEGSPLSPVFASAEELAKWCSENLTTFGANRASEDKWLKMLRSGFIYHKEGILMCV